jgi:formylglycine-generating enzyme required for sulfatase activity
MIGGGLGWMLVGMSLWACISIPDVATGEDSVVSGEETIPMEMETAQEDSGVSGDDISPDVTIGENSGVSGEETSLMVEEIDLVFVSGGCFQMGNEDGYSDEQPVHDVCLDDFWIGRYEVSQDEWANVMANNPSSFSDCPNCPVEEVSWNDVQEFIKKLNIKTGQHYSLPSEAEWEYAARGGVSSQGYTYSGSNELDVVAWYNNNSGGKTHSVGEKQPNELGLYDMSGNVWEWVLDWYGDSYYGSSPLDNPVGPSAGSDRVSRGGSWFEWPQYCWATGRSGYDPASRLDNLGFRLRLAGR